MSTRNNLSLSGEWQFWKDPQGRYNPEHLPEDGSSTIQVPAPWQSQGDDLRDYVGIGWYRRNFQVEPDWLENRRLILLFGAVDYLAQVWVNGQPIGEHEGGYLPFELDITPLVSPGENTVTVRVSDRLEDFAEIPHGKQSWYGPLSGIWQDVWLESRTERTIQQVRITPQGEQVHVKAALNAPLTTSEGLVYVVRAPDETEVASGRAEAETFVIAVNSPLLWSPETPHLYTLELTLETGNAKDTVIETFGFRTIETRDGQILLNGQPLYLRGALDQDYYPELIYTPPSGEYIEAQLHQAKALGLNCMRVHIKIADPRYYAAADRVGILIWTELPNWKNLSEAARRRALETLDGMLERDWNHPSIIIWTIINENWGTDLTHNAAHRAWLRDMYLHVKEIDPLRLVVDNSACHSNYHIITDLEDYHNYYVQPDHYKQWRDWVDSLASRSGWSFSPELEDIEAWVKIKKDHWNPEPRRYAPEVQRRGDEPLLVSEFGNWGLPDIEQLRVCYGGQDPWWFETGYNWGQGVVYPHGVDQRFKDYHLGRVFDGLAGLTTASQELQFQAMKYEIEQMRRHPSIQGYVITEFTDLHWECNGLLDMCRNPKVYYDRFHTINADTVIVPEWERLAYQSGETCQVILLVAHHSLADLTGSHLIWHMEGFPEIHGELSPLDIQSFSVSGAGTIHFVVPNVALGRRARLSMTLMDRTGETAAENSLEIAILPQLALPNGGMKIYAPELGDRLEALGYNLASSVEDAQLAIVPQLTQSIYRYLQDGGKVLWLAESDPEPNPMDSWKVCRRADTHWQGDWASSFSWIASDGPFQHLPSAGVVDFVFAGITPDHVISGVTPDEFGTGVHAGLFVGWLQHNTALVAERQVGEGQLLISTFQLSENWSINPLAAAMLHDLIDHMVSSAD
jgi:hypothetical protein